jgi:hypothetical protein
MPATVAIDPVLQGKRDYSACALDSSPTAGQIAARD